MSTARKLPQCRRASGFVAAATAVFLALPVSAQAQGAHLSLRQTSDEGVASWPSPQEPESAGRQKAVRAQEVYYGRAPYICTPSGFGRTASCFLRAKLGG